jgi:hypothetical protein
MAPIALENVAIIANNAAPVTHKDFKYGDDTEYVFSRRKSDKTVKVKTI